MLTTYFQYRTRGDTSPQGKPRVYFCCHPEDFDRFFRQITEEILELQNCAVYYYPPEANVINLSTKVPSTSVIARSAATWQSVFSLVTCSKSGRCKGNGLPHQSADWFAMTGKSDPGSLS